MINRLKNKGKRFKLSYDGQVLRIINLPKNYKDYPYILASFPNSYYEKETSATKQKRKGSKTPAQTSKILSDEDKDMICAKIKKNVELRLNVDYRKTFTSKWKSDLMNTYIDPNKQKSVNAYIKAAKARKVVLSSGIGLSIVKKIIEDHGGKIWATSKEDSGTTMYFVIRKYQEVTANEQNTDR